MLGAVIDLDFEEAEQITITGEDHYIPKCFKNYGVRIAIPATSKRRNMSFQIMLNCLSVLFQDVSIR